MPEERDSYNVMTHNDLLNLIRFYDTAKENDGVNRYVTL